MDTPIRPAGRDCSMHMCPVQLIPFKQADFAISRTTRSHIHYYLVSVDPQVKYKDESMPLYTTGALYTSFKVEPRSCQQMQQKKVHLFVGFLEMELEQRHKSKAHRILLNVEMCN